MESDANSALVEVEVEFDYEAELADELSIKVGDVIKEVKRMDGGWWEGTLSGKRGVFPDNFVKVLSRDPPKARGIPPSTTSTTTTTPSATEDIVQLRRGQVSRVSGNASNKKKCRVLFSYQPKHDDELELKLEDVVEFLSEVEDGWWKGKLRGRVGVFPSNFVEMLKNANEQGQPPASTPDQEQQQTVADKNKRNERLKVEKTQRPASKISSLIQEAENKAAAKKKSSIENLNLVKRESPLGGEDNKTDDLSNAPKLPPKPVKEQCVVLFPYNAVNDDELSLEEGQIITIVTKDVEDKGWWKGEIDGRVGVFPDNFVKLISSSTTTTSASATPVTTEDVKVKKPSRPPGTNKIPAPTSGKSSTSGSLRKLPDSAGSSASSSREKLNGSSDKIHRKSMKDTSGSSLPSPKKHSFGKATPPPKPKPPSLSAAVNKGSTGSLNNTSSPLATNTSSTNESAGLDDLDLVPRSDNKLAHPTAERVKAPKRRPPSSVFQKEAKLSGDAFEALQIEPSSNTTSSSDASNVDLKRSASQGSLHGSDDNLLSTSSRQESKNRLSFKMVRQTMKEALGTFSSSSTNEKSKEPRRTSEPPKASSPTKPSPPTPIISPEPVVSNATETSNDQAKKPDWLAELSRKQANRRSGMFSNNNSNEEVKPGTSPPKVPTESKPVIAPDKPHIPLKPSQIREEARKSAAFPKRQSNESIVSNNNNDKENNKPQAPTKPIKNQEDNNKTASKVIESKPILSSTNIAKLAENPAAAPTEVTKPHESPSKTPPIPTVVGWKPSIIQAPQPASEDKKELTLEERVKKLEDLVTNMKANYESKIDHLTTQLEVERTERKRLEDEIKLKINH